MRRTLHVTLATLDTYRSKATHVVKHGELVPSIVAIPELCRHLAAASAAANAAAGRERIS